MSDDLDGLMRKAMDDVATAHADWLNRCLRSIDPRDLCYVVQVMRRGCPDEDLVLRGQTIGEWRVRRDRDRLKITMRVPATG